MDPASPLAAESVDQITTRMVFQRQQLHRQFSSPPAAPILAPTAETQTAGAALQPYQPRSMTMRLLVANPQILQRALLLAATTVIGTRYSSWAVRLIGFFLSTRSRRG